MEGQPRFGVDPARRCPPAEHPRLRRRARVDDVAHAAPDGRQHGLQHHRRSRRAPPGLAQPSGDGAAAQGPPRPQEQRHPGAAGGSGRSWRWLGSRQ
eukprot:scaffold32722_cov100-Isochrysis_galbana.AAC.3